MATLAFIQLLDREAGEVRCNISITELSAVAKKTDAYQTALDQFKKGASERVVRMQLRKAVLEALGKTGSKKAEN